MSEENTSVALDAPLETSSLLAVAPDVDAGSNVATKAAPRKRATPTTPRTTKARATKKATTPEVTTPEATAEIQNAAEAPRATTTRKPRATSKKTAASTADGAENAASSSMSEFSGSDTVVNDGAPQTGKGAPDANVQAPLPLDAPPQVLATVQPIREQTPTAESAPTPTQETPVREAASSPPPQVATEQPVAPILEAMSPAAAPASETSTLTNNGAAETNQAETSQNANNEGESRDFNRSNDRFSGGRFRGRDGREMRQGRTFRPRGNGVENGEYRADNNGSGDNRPQDNRPPDNRPQDNRSEGRNDNRESYNDNRPEGRQFQNGQGRRGRFGQYDNRDNQGRDNQGREGREPQPPRRPELDWATLEEKNALELREIARELGVVNTLGLKSHDLMMKILEAQAEQAGNLIKHGIIEMQNDGKGFLRCSGYLQNDGDVYVSQSQIKRFNLKTGDMVTGLVRAPKEMERYHGLLRVEAINGESIEAMRTRKEFEKLTPIFPDEKFKLEIDQTNITARIIDLVSPIGKGQRGLIVAPPKAGKTTLLKSIANSISLNHPEVTLIVLLIDERPEEVTDISRSVKGEVVASTFDEMPENHMRVAELVFEKAKRLVEQHKDVVILLDSITRLSRASNLVVTPSGRTLSGGLDPAAMYRPKRMFGAARNIEEGGSLTILATTLVETGSRMDEMIFEEFKGTGNMDLVLDRDLFNQRIFPAIDINKSGTRRDDLLMSKDDLAATFHLRRTLAALDNDKAITLLIDRLKNTKTNSDFMAVVQRSQRNSANPAVSGG